MDDSEQRATPGRKVWHENEAHERLIGLCVEIRRIDLERARCLAAIAHSKHYRFLGCASLREYGRNQGLRPCETWDRARAGMLLETRPDLEEKLLSGQITFEAAASLYEVVTLEGEDTEAWIDLASEESTPVLTARVEERLPRATAGIQAGEDVRPALGRREGRLRRSPEDPGGARGSQSQRRRGRREDLLLLRRA